MQMTSLYLQNLTQAISTYLVWSLLFVLTMSGNAWTLRSRFGRLPRTPGPQDFQEACMHLLPWDLTEYSFLTAAHQHFPETCLFFFSCLKLGTLKPRFYFENSDWGTQVGKLRSEATCPFCKSSKYMGQERRKSSLPKLTTKYKLHLQAYIINLSWLKYHKLYFKFLLTEHRQARAVYNNRA